MSYDVANLLHDARQRPGGVRSLAASVGQAEGGSAQRQHEAACAFWEAALGLTGDDALNAGERAIAEAEIARHTAALVPPALGPQRTAVV